MRNSPSYTMDPDDSLREHGRRTGFHARSGVDLGADGFEDLSAFWGANSTMGTNDSVVRSVMNALGAAEEAEAEAAEAAVAAVAAVAAEASEAVAAAREGQAHGEASDDVFDELPSVLGSLREEDAAEAAGDEGEGGGGEGAWGESMIIAEGGDASSVLDAAATHHHHHHHHHHHSNDSGVLGEEEAAGNRSEAERELLRVFLEKHNVGEHFDVLVREGARSLADLCLIDGEVRDGVRREEGGGARRGGGVGVLGRACRRNIVVWCALGRRDVSCGGEVLRICVTVRVGSARRACLSSPNGVPSD